MDDKVTANPNFTDFLTVGFQDEDGNPVNPVNQSGDTITDANLLQVSYTGPDLTGTGQKYTFVLGSPAVDVCIPVGAIGSFSVYTTINSDVEDGAVIEASTHINKNYAL